MLKICDFFVVRVAPFHVLAPQAGSETSIDWNALEFSAGEEQEEHCAPGRPWAGGVMAEEWAPSPREQVELRQQCVSGPLWCKAEVSPLP